MDEEWAVDEIGFFADFGSAASSSSRACTGKHTSQNRRGSSGMLDVDASIMDLSTEDSAKLARRKIAGKIKERAAIKERVAGKTRVEKIEAKFARKQERKDAVAVKLLKNKKVMAKRSSGGRRKKTIR